MDSVSASIKGSYVKDDAAMPSDIQHDDRRTRPLGHGRSGEQIRRDTVDLTGFEEWRRRGRRRRLIRVGFVVMGVAVLAGAVTLWLRARGQHAAPASEVASATSGQVLPSQPKARSHPRDAPTPKQDVKPAKVRAVPRNDKVLIEPVYRQARAIRSATAVGVNYSRFGELLQGFVTELSIASDKVRSQEGKAALAKYAEGAGCYKDSLTLWKGKIDSTNDMWLGKIPFFDKQDEVGLLAQKYELPFTEHELQYPNQKWFGLSAECIQLVWIHAESKMDEADRLYLEE